MNVLYHLPSIFQPLVLQPAHPLLATLSSHPLSSHRGSQLSIFTFRPRNSSEADFADDEHSIHDTGRSRAGSMATPWHKRRTGSIRSHSSQVFTPTLTLNGRLNLSLEQNGITSPGLHTPTSFPAFSMEQVKEGTVWSYLHHTRFTLIKNLYVCPPKHKKVVIEENAQTHLSNLICMEKSRVDGFVPKVTTISVK